MRFIDYSKVFDCVEHDKLWKVLQKLGISPHLTQLIRSLYTDQKAVVRTQYGDTEWFRIERGVRQAVLILAGIFDLVLVFILRWKCLIVLVIWVFHSFSRRKVIAFLSTFSQTAVTNIYFGSYFIWIIQSKIVINSSLFRPNHLSLFEIWIKDWIWKNWNKFSFFGRDTN